MIAHPFPVCQRGVSRKERKIFKKTKTKKKKTSSYILFPSKQSLLEQGLASRVRARIRRPRWLDSTRSYASMIHDPGGIHIPVAQRISYRHALWLAACAAWSDQAVKGWSVVVDGFCPQPNRASSSSPGCPQNSPFPPPHPASPVYRPYHGRRGNRLCDVEMPILRNPKPQHKTAPSIRQAVEPYPCRVRPTAGAQLACQIWLSRARLRLFSRTESIVPQLPRVQAALHCCVRSDSPSL